MIVSEALCQLPIWVSSFQITCWCVSIKRCWVWSELWMLNFLFFLNVGICYRCVVPSSYIHGLVSSVALCGSWCGSDWVCIAFPKSVCSFALEENPSGKIVPRWILLCISCYRTGMIGFSGCWHGVWYLAVLGCYWGQWNEAGQMQLTSPSRICVPSLRLDANISFLAWD